MKRIMFASILLALLSAWVALPAAAQVASIPITSVSERLHVMGSGGGIVLTTGDDWSGASLGGTVVYNLHQQFSVFGGYDHGFPVNDVDRSLDFWRAVGNVRVHPNAGIGFGYGWFGEDVEGGLTQLVVSKIVLPRLSVGGLYAHVFSAGEIDDFEYAKVYLNYHLFGKE
jgi:opacity protein-like surface antigen